VTRALAALSIIGLAIAGYLTYVHYGEVEPFCTGISDCVRVQSSEYAELAGVPVAVLGLVGYAAILGSLALAAEVTALLAYLALGFSAYLTWAELFRIHAICQWCVASALTITAIAVLATTRAVRAGRATRPTAAA
jgi:uncharacterized membrane protein